MNKLAFFKGLKTGLEKQAIGFLPMMGAMLASSLLLEGGKYLAGYTPKVTHVADPMFTDTVNKYFDMMNNKGLNAPLIQNMGLLSEISKPSVLAPLGLLGYGGYKLKQFMDDRSKRDFEIANLIKNFKPNNIKSKRKKQNG